MQVSAVRSVRQVLALVIILLLAGLLQACGGGADQAPASDSSAAPESGEPVVNALGKELPADAAPLDQQVLVYPYSGWKPFTTIDVFESVYQRADSLSDLLSDGLVRLDKNFELQPGAATDWSVDESGRVWTFNLDPNLMWNDGTPVTADDYVATFQYGADPEHAWDFTWYYSGVIKNWSKVVAGEAPLEELGVRAVDDHTLMVELEQPTSYFPYLMAFSAIDLQIMFLTSRSCQ